MQKIKKFESYVNEDYSFKEVLTKGKEKVKNLIDRFISLGKGRVIPNGPKKGNPVINVYEYNGPGSIINALEERYPVVESKVFENSGIPDPSEIYVLVPDEKDRSYGSVGKESYRAHLESDPKTGIPNVYGDDLIETLREKSKKVLMGYTPPPLFIFGAPGIGKTKIVGQIAEEMKGSLIDVACNCMQPEDFVGVPKMIEIEKPSEKNLIGRGITRHNINAKFPVDPLSKGIIFFDEMNRADPTVLSSLLLFSRERRIGNYYLPEGWLIVAAGNRDQDVVKGSSITKLGSAFADRYSIINYVPTIESFLKFVENSNSPGLPGTDLNDNPRKETIREVFLPVLVQFLKWDDSFFYTTRDPENKESNTANPRSWVKAAQKIYSLLEDMRAEGKEKIPEKLLYQKLTEIIGSKAAVAFMNYYRVYNDIDLNSIENILKDGKNADLPKKDDEGKYRPDVLFAVANALLSILSRKGKITLAEYHNILEWSVRLNRPEYFKAIQGAIDSYFKKGMTGGWPNKPGNGSKEGLSWGPFQINPNNGPAAAGAAAMMATRIS
jgi:hypothetical protein